LQFRFYWCSPGFRRGTQQNQNQNLSAKERSFRRLHRWKPVWNVLEGQFHLLLVNAQHVKNVPGRKTDVKDSEWIAELLQHGLLRPSFVPEARIRDLRDLTRARASLSEEASRVVSRIQKVLEDANIN
jgi:transposase